MRGVIRTFVEADGLGNIELEDGRTIRFGVTACRELGVKPSVGLEVLVGDLVAGYGGVMKAKEVRLASSPAAPPKLEHASFRFVTTIAADGAPLVFGEAKILDDWHGSTLAPGAPAIIVEQECDGEVIRTEHATPEAAARHEQKILKTLLARHPGAAKVGRNPEYLDAQGQVVFRIRVAKAPSQLDDMQAKLRGSIAALDFAKSRKAVFAAGARGQAVLALTEASFVVAIGTVPAAPEAYLDALSKARPLPNGNATIRLAGTIAAFDARRAARTLTSKTLERALGKAAALPLACGAEISGAVFRVEPWIYRYAAADLELAGSHARVVRFEALRPSPPR